MDINLKKLNNFSTLLAYQYSFKIFFLLNFLVFSISSTSHAQITEDQSNSVELDMFESIKKS